MTVKWGEHISVDPNICHGKACIRGTCVFAVISASQPSPKQLRKVSRAGGLGKLALRLLPS
jgi:hypothetical protein